MGTSQPNNNNQNKEQLTCSECILIPKIINIDYNNYLIEYECPKHGIKTEGIKEYFKSSKIYLYNSNQNNNSGNNNNENRNQIIYYCIDCKNFLCERCGDNHEHKKSLFMKIIDPRNNDDIYLNKYCTCNKRLFDGKTINCRNKEEQNKEEQDIDSQFLEKLKKKTKEIEEKIENEKCINELLNRLITIYEGQNNDLNKHNIINAYKNINENGSEMLLKKIENLENKISYYLEKKLGIIIKDNTTELNLNGKGLCELDLTLLKESNKDLKNLIKLDLGNNNIRDIGILKDFNLPNLRVLILEHNKIDKIDNLIDILKVNRKIETINLSHNLINKVDVNKINDNAFLYVKDINLDGNDEIKKEFKEIKEILKLNKKIQKYENCILKYKIEEEETIIFGSEFVSHNANKCKLYINGKEKELCDNYINEQGGIKSNILYVKMIFQEGIVDISNIFDGCTSLISISDISKWNISNVTKMNRLFNQCISLVSLPDISQWDTSNVTTMERLFNACYSLKSLPDISKWNTSKVITMEGLFYQCKSLTSLPNIGEWDTSNVTNMNYLFYHCYALKSLPDLGKWNFSNVATMFYMFSNCSSLAYLPDLSRLNISNVSNLSNLFEGCSSLKSLSDISKWDTSKVQNMSNMFSGCTSLEHLPDLSKWDFSSVVDMSNMFEGCINLRVLPVIP